MATEQTGTTATAEAQPQPAAEMTVPQAAATYKRLTGLEKAAVLMITLGAEASAEVFRHLKPDELEHLANELVRQEKVSVEVKKLVFDEFTSLYRTSSMLSQGGVDYARAVLEQAIGPQKAQQLIERICSIGVATPSEWLEHVEPNLLARALQVEQPQTIALMLSQLPGQKAAQVLGSLAPEMQSRVTMKLAKMEAASPEVVQQIEESLRHRMSGVGSEKVHGVGGVQAVVNILNSGDRALERTILDSLSQNDPALADDVKRRLFVFEDILQLEDRAVQVVLREVEQEDLRLALRGSQDNVKDKIFKNMSERAASSLKEDIEMSGPVRLRDVEGAQQRIALSIRALEERGEISIVRGESPGDQFV